MYTVCSVGVWGTLCLSYLDFVHTKGLPFTAVKHIPHYTLVDFPLQSFVGAVVTTAVVEKTTHTNHKLVIFPHPKGVLQARLVYTS